MCRITGLKPAYAFVLCAATLPCVQVKVHINCNFQLAQCTVMHAKSQNFAESVCRVQVEPT